MCCHYKIFADYFQFYLEDEHAQAASTVWTHDAVENLLVLAPGTIGVGTVRNMYVPVSVEVLDAFPADDDFSIWDHVNECSIDIPSGKLVIVGCTDYFPDAARILVKPGTYRARIYYGKLDKLSEDGLDGEDHYKIALWLEESTNFVVLKKRRMS